MEDKRVSYATALLAKEKGFNVFCEWQVDEEGVEEFRYSDWVPNNAEYTYTSDKDPEVIAYEERGKKLVNQPTQSLLQKWLREEHNMHLSIIFDIYTFDVKIMRIQGDGWRQKQLISSLSEVTPYLFTEYEQTLEVGLQEGLKLLKDEQ